MLKNSAPIFLILVLLFSLSCSQDQAPATTPQINIPLPGSTIGVPSGAYKYFGFDSNNKVVVGGWIRFNPAQINFRGKWHLEAADMWEFGPQVGTGTLEGSAKKSFAVSCDD